jgi:L-cysteine/cystine lyase
VAAEVTFEEARAVFPVLERVAYLNAGSMGPLMRPTVDAVVAASLRDLEHGRGGRPYYDAMIELRDGIRARIAALLSVEAAHIALTDSTTDGCNVVLAGFDLGPDDEVVTSDAEHPGLLAPLHATGARVVVAPTSEHRAADALQVFLERVTPRTRLLALSHVCWTTGQVFPVEELKRETGLPILVDGAQSVGAIEVGAGDADYYTVSCQKWLCGPDQLGALYVRNPERLRVARPSGFGVESIEKDGSFAPKDGAARFDSGWLAMPSLAGLVAALDHAPGWRFERARRTAAQCRAALAEAGLEVVTEPDQATLCSFVPKGDAEETVAAAFERGVIIRFLPSTGWCRASCGYWTSAEDLERLVAVVA